MTGDTELTPSETSIRDSAELEQEIGADLADETGQQTLLSRIPHLSGGPRTASGKAEYLGFRATGFPIRQALYLTDVSHATLKRWRDTDPEFADIETNKIKELQSSVGNDLVHLGFLRNMRLSMQVDFKILLKAVHHMESLTDREFQYLKRMRSLYGAQELLAVNRAIMPEGEGPSDFSELVLSITEKRTEVRIAQKQHHTEPDIIEAESERA